MPVADQKILKKMMSELKQAMESEYDPSKMKGHIRAIRLLTDLLLEEETSIDEEAVLKKMKEDQQIKEPNVIEKKERPTIDHEGANGSSIFDF